LNPAYKRRTNPAFCAFRPIKCKPPDDEEQAAAGKKYLLHLKPMQNTPKLRNYAQN